MKHICKNCQYFRDESWCSNSKSTHFRYLDPEYQQWVNPTYSCDKFYAAGLKAPWWLRLLNKIMGFVGK
jgi:hypothetical protein